HLDKAHTLIQRNSSGIAWIDEQIDMTSPFLPRQRDNPFDQLLPHTLTAYLTFDSNAELPAADWLICIVGFENDGSQPLTSRINGHKGWIALLCPTAPIPLFGLLYGFKPVMR